MTDKEILQFVYDNTNDTSKMKVYNMINIASVLLGIRTGAIITRFNRDRFPQLQTYMTANHISTKIYPIGTNLILLVRNSAGASKAAFNRIQEYTPPPVLAPLSYSIPEPNNEPSLNELAARRATLNRNTGAVLGYFTPIALKNANKTPKAIKYSIMVKTPDKTETISFFPQRISGELYPHYDRMLEMEANLRMQLPRILPDGFTLESVKFESSTSSGGRRHRRSKRNSMRRRRLAKHTRRKRT